MKSIFAANFFNTYHRIYRFISVPATRANLAHAEKMGANKNHQRYLSWYLWSIATVNTWVDKKIYGQVQI